MTTTFAAWLNERAQEDGPTGDLVLGGKTLLALLLGPPCVTTFFCLPVCGIEG